MRKINTVAKFVDFPTPEALDWPLAKMLLAAGYGCNPHVFEAPEGDGGGWEVCIDVCEPGIYEPFREGLWILDAQGSSDNMKWPTLDAARKAIRDALLVDVRTRSVGVSVHFLRC